MRITKKVFTDLAIYMVSFGVLIGIIFPFFVSFFEVPKEVAYSVPFFSACIGAGLLVGFVNIMFVRRIILERIRVMTQKMETIEMNLKSLVVKGEMNHCTVDNCKISVDSEDDFGKSAESYNNLVETLSIILHGDELGNYLQIEMVAEQALKKLLEVTRSTAGAVVVSINADFEIVKNTGIKNIESILSNPVVLQAFETQNTLDIQMPKNVVIDLALIEFKPKQVLIKPIVYNGSSIGLVILASHDLYDEKRKEHVDILFKSLIQSLGNALAHSKIEKLATSDYLTEVYNKRFGLIRLNEELEMVKRHHKPLSIIMFDLDHFKKVNDNFGHLAGDKVLVQVAKTTQEEIRSSDVLFRFGGEEFMIILRETTLDDAYNLAERLRKTIESRPIQYLDKIISITSSFGIASTENIDSMIVDDLISAVDSALYKSKEYGRNRVTVAKDFLSSKIL